PRVKPTGGEMIKKIINGGGARKSRGHVSRCMTLLITPAKGGIATALQLCFGCLRGIFRPLWITFNSIETRSPPTITAFWTAKGLTSTHRKLKQKSLRAERGPRHAWQRDNPRV